MPQYERAVIVGVGLLGGSIGLALRDKGLARTVIGVGRNVQSLRHAVDGGAISEFSESIEQACHHADLVLICTPVQHICQWVHECLKQPLHPRCLVTDVGSTKSNILGALSQAATTRFCGSHPIAGSEKSGVQFASADLFQGKLTIVTPSPTTPHEITKSTEEFWRSLGSRTIQMTAEEHDQAMARISHLPHLLASALANSTQPSLLPLAGSGWLDCTRIAAGNVEMWQQIIAENRRPIVRSLQEFSSHLQEWIQAIESGDDHQVEMLLRGGKERRDAIG